MLPEDPSAVAVREWLHHAARDLLVADRLASDAEVANAVAFHAQQAIEKALKGFLAQHGQAFPKTQNLGYLMVQCGAFDAAFDALRDTTAPLTRFAVAGRYPDDAIDASLQEADAARSWAHRVYRFVLERVPEPACP